MMRASFIKSTILSFAILCLMAGASYAQTMYAVGFSEKSSLRIDGSSNVNEFCCQWIAGEDVSNISVSTERSEKNKVDLNHSILRFPLRSFFCDNSRMTKDFLELMNSDDFPFIELTIRKAQLYPTNGDMFHVNASIQMDIAGISKIKNVRFLVKENGNSFQFTGTEKILMSEFGIDPPTVLLGLVKVVDELELVFDLELRVKEKG